ncbi:Retrovirus-related Pol polyprotein from transposon RE1 [Vitis vinifera]|uniref:Retrovirus-related Pol polyprotein from transposon RE1 n=1 Tax=Vitis vinifera TaxID=29760 RepID=A0A438JU06_VITVI|nr:Retrovirus-related Pol polyprotein from transposon RE1 [Vitis vinifera]
MRPWIVDTGASDHMTGDAAILQNYKPSNGHSSVHIADGSKSKIAGTGLEIGKMIGSAELCSGLYLLSCGQFSNQVSQASCVQSQSMSESFNSVSNSKSAYLSIPTSTFLKTVFLTPMPPLLIYHSKYLVVRHSFMCILKIVANLLLEQISAIFLGILQPKKGTNAILQPTKDFTPPWTSLSLNMSSSIPNLMFRGESMNEHQVWESFLDGVPSFHSESPNPSQFAPTELSTPMPPSVQPAQHTNVPSPVTIQSPMPIQPIAPQLANENLQVYIRRRKRQELEHGSQSTCGQYIDSNSSLPEENIGEDRAGEVLIPSIDDSTLPIALRKGVRRCTDHPIGNYVTYEGLSPSYRAFATSLDDTQVPNTIQEALKISEWKKAVQDEIDALEKNGTWTITDLPVGKRPDPSLIGCQSRLVLATTGHKKCVSKWDLEEEVYMEIPPGFEENSQSSPEAGYKQGQADHTLFVKKSHAGKLAILIVYVDDIILSGNDMGELQNLKKSRKGIVVSQRKYILDLLKETGMLGCKPIDTPMDSQKKLGIEKETPLRKHMEAVYRILRYLKMTPGKGLFFRKTENRDTEVYSDADWAGNIIDRRSTSGYCSFVWGNLVTWRSKKQSVVARSSAEAEYRALAQGIL